MKKIMRTDWMKTMKEMKTIKKDNNHEVKDYDDIINDQGDEENEFTLDLRYEAPMTCWSSFYRNRRIWGASSKKVGMGSDPLILGTGKRVCVIIQLLLLLLLKSLNCT